MLHAGHSHSTSTQSQNTFVQTALSYALSYVSTLTSSAITPASITILADTDYYSHGGVSNPEHAPSTNRFLDFNLPLNLAHKTGLGSSAALVTAFTAAVLTHYLPSQVQLTTGSGQACLHNLAQAAHCAAQGKIGSGFDVAAAVYGSCIYRRFSPSLLDGLNEAGKAGFSAHLRAVVEDSNPVQKWDTGINKSAANLPRGLRLVMCDVDCGSETVGLVKRVLLWRKEQSADAALLWATLQKGNEDLAEELQTLSNSPGAPYEDLREIILTIRSLIREMSERSGVPIEPKVQTDLLDACSSLPGVVGGVVPGAGGFDAIALLVEDKNEVVDGLQRFLAGYAATGEDGVEANVRKVRLLDVKQEMQGMKAEDIAIYSDWLQ